MALREWGWDDQWAQHAARLGADSSKAARVVGQDRASWTVQSHSGPVTARIPSASCHDHNPVVGDWVIAEPGPMPTDPWSILAVFPRRSCISRGAAGTGKSEQVLAANVDKIWVVHGLDLQFNPRRLERYLAVVWARSHVGKVLVLKRECTRAIALWTRSSCSSG